jgi:hypothetical protein
MTGFRAMVCAVLSAGVLLAGCGDPPPEEPAKPSAGARNNTAPKVPSSIAQMVAAVSTGKTATAVGVHFSLGTTPRVGTALPVDIAVITHEDFVSLRVHFESQDGLTLVSGEELPPRLEVKAETTLPHQLVLMPARDGVYMVTVIVDTEGKEGLMSRIFFIPVIVVPAVAPAEPKPAPPAAPPAADSAGS